MHILTVDRNTGVRYVKRYSNNRYLIIVVINVQIGICYGMQMIVKTLGGEVSKRGVTEDGSSEIEVDTKCLLFA